MRVHVSEPRAHELRAVASSLAYMGGVALADVLQAVGWRQESTFVRHYLRQIRAPEVPLALPQLS